MIHLYYGDGKGKTTAAAGLAVRAAGAGMRVLFAQFFKDGSSSEIRVLSSLQGVETVHPGLHFGRWRTMNDGQRAEIGENYRTLFAGIASTAEKFDLIVLDEAVSAYGYGVLDRAALTDFLRAEGKKREIVLTGRNPAPELLEIADYATEMRKEKHPFDSGVTARRGVEY
ncbi:MAG: cob(I)yrinic acid a,c-diamide adenosyltransferase [Clostridia bacterium]|nr:cob(I)yrinic acid a,c-diamide adenosyltransferase [Clostridia bacterium]